MAQCRRLADPAERLACYDALPAAPDPIPAVPPQATGSDPASLFGLDPAARSRALQASAGISAPESIEAAVADVRVRPDGRLELRLDNGQRWVQTEAANLRARPGDRVRIREAALGSYLLQKNETGRGFRVRRLAAPPD